MSSASASSSIHSMPFSFCSVCARGITRLFLGRERFYTPPPPGSNFRDCKCVRIETNFQTLLYTTPSGWWWWYKIALLSSRWAYNDTMIHKPITRGPVTGGPKKPRYAILITSSSNSSSTHHYDILLLLWTTIYYYYILLLYVTITYYYYYYYNYLYIYIYIHMW